MDLEAVEDADITSAEGEVRRYLRRRLRNPAVVDDLTQETMTRLLEVRHRLGRSAAVPYAVTVAKHLVVAEGRSASVAERHLHRFSVDPPLPPPDELVLAREDEAALRTAIDALPDEDRALLLDHVVGGVDTATLAARAGGTAGGVAAKLARARARARVDYVVASNRASLPTSQCRPVLLSLSAADARRQKATGAPGHLAGCTVCAALGPQLVHRRRSLAMLLPIPVVVRSLGAVRAFVRSHAALSASGAVGAVAVATAVAVSSSSPPHHAAVPPTTTRAPATAPAPDVDIGRLIAIPPTQWPQLAGRRVVARSVPILSVPADEGFWIGSDAAHRVWVQIATRGESPVRVVAGHRISFRGRLVRHGAGFAVQAGVGRAAGAQQLTALAVHVTVSASALNISP